MQFNKRFAVNLYYVENKRQVKKYRCGYQTILSKKQKKK